MARVWYTLNSKFIHNIFSTWSTEKMEKEKMKTQMNFAPFCVWADWAVRVVIKNKDTQIV